MNQELPIDLSFEKISKTGEREESKIFGRFTLEGKTDSQLSELEEQIQETDRKRKKAQQKRKQK